VLSIFVFFSASHSKLIPYITPLFPPLAIMVAHYISRARMQNLCIAYAVTIIINIVIFIAVMFAISSQHLVEQIPQEAHVALMAIALCWLIASLIASICAWQDRRSVAMVALALLSVIGFIILNDTANDIDTRSIKPLAIMINHERHPGDLIVSYKHYYQDLPFYTQHKVIIVDWINELAFGLTLDPLASQWVMTRPEFTQWLRNNNGEHTLFIVLQTRDISSFQQDYAGTYHLLGHTPQSTLLSIHGASPNE
jgi:4-amino-4-deoxy-L-arabinose transferase-like glycosyltransferase